MDLVWAKVTGHPYWPARVASNEEEQRHARFKQRKSDILVHFFATDDSGSYGWVTPSNIKVFDVETCDSMVSASKNKSLKAAVVAAREFWGKVQAQGDFSQLFDPGVCSICAKDASWDTILICDKCDSEWHLACLDPPATEIPEGEWFCPKCDPTSFHGHRKRAPSSSSTVHPARDNVSQAKIRKLSSAKASSDSAVDNSENTCMVCGHEGKLLVCEFEACFKVFHEYCIWPASFSVEDAETRWVCPRHTCSICTIDESDTARQCSASIRKCSECTISACDKHNSSIFADNNIVDTEKCRICLSSSPQVQLAKILQKAWSKLANHYLALPFMRPLLSVTTTPEVESSWSLLLSLCPAQAWRDAYRTSDWTAEV